jgi:hypothetical protein
MFNQPVLTSGGRDVTTTGDYKALASVPSVAKSLASTIINMVPLDFLIPMVIKGLLIQVSKGMENQFPGEVCG